jgi:hypothetical protein
VYRTKKAPLASRETVGPNPALGNTAVTEVIVTGSVDKQPVLDTEPEITTVPPAVTVEGVTTTAPLAAAAGDATMRITDNVAPAATPAAFTSHAHFLIPPMGPSSP